jgi:predicted lactoylglutathione lyase
MISACGGSPWTMATTTKNPRMIFVNLPVRDLSRTKEFFTKLGFEYDPRFTDDKAACMILSDQGYVMLLARPFFETFTKRQICDTSTHTEALLALSCASRAEVDELVRTAIEAGGQPAMDKQDHGFMYGWSFYDLDGHHWEVMWMDPKALTESPPHQQS